LRNSKLLLLDVHCLLDTLLTILVGFSVAFKLGNYSWLSKCRNGKADSCYCAWQLLNAYSVKYVAPH